MFKNILFFNDPLLPNLPTITNQHRPQPSNKISFYLLTFGILSPRPHFWFDFIAGRNTEADQIENTVSSEEKVQQSGQIGGVPVGAGGGKLNQHRQHRGGHRG